MKETNHKQVITIKWTTKRNKSLFFSNCYFYPNFARFFCLESICFPPIWGNGPFMENLAYCNTIVRSVFLTATAEGWPWASDWAWQKKKKKNDGPLAKNQLEASPRAVSQLWCLGHVWVLSRPCLGHIWDWYLGLESGTELWVWAMSGKSGTEIWDWNLGLKYETEIWDWI